MITLFISFTLHRFLSGIRNGMLYNSKQGALAAPYIIGLVQMLISICMAAIVINSPQWWFVNKYVAAFIIGGSLPVCALFTFMALQYNAPKSGWQVQSDIHLWTELEQIALCVPLLLAGWPGLIALACSVYPSVFLQKAGLNRMLESSIWDNQTDDTTGATYNIPSLGIKIPRTTQRTRAWFAVISIIVLTIIQFI